MPVENPFLKIQGPGGRAGPDAIRITKNELRFNALTIKRVNAVPSAYEGRPGDIFIIDNTDSPDPTGADSFQQDRTPTAVGLWMKQPLSYRTSPKYTHIIGLPAAGADNGDELAINGTTVTFTSPFNSPDQAVIDINNANIPNIMASIIGESIMISETSNGNISFNNITGDPINHMGLFNVPSFTNDPPNGAWVPVVDVATAGNPSSSAAASVLTMFGEPSLPNSRTITAGDAVRLTDGGAGGTLTFDHDITNVPAITEPIASDDEALIYNKSTGKVEKVKYDDVFTVLADQGGFAQAVGGDPIGTGSSNNIGPVVKAGSNVVRVTLSIITPYDTGTTMSIGTDANPGLLMDSSIIDPTIQGSQMNIPVSPVTVDTQFKLFIAGTPTNGASEVYLDVV